MSDPIKVELSLRWSEERIQDEVIASLTNYFRGQIGQEIDKVVRASIEAAISQQAENAVAEYLTRPIQQTDEWGQPKGGETTLAEFVSKKFEERMVEKVDAHGRSDSYSSEKKLTRLDWLAKTITTEKLEAQVKATLVEVRQQGEAAVKTAIAEMIVKHLKPAA